MEKAIANVGSYFFAIIGFLIIAYSLVKIAFRIAVALGARKFLGFGPLPNSPFVQNERPLWRDLAEFILGVTLAGMFWSGYWIIFVNRLSSSANQFINSLTR